MRRHHSAVLRSSGELLKQGFYIRRFPQPIAFPHLKSLLPFAVLLPETLFPNQNSSLTFLMKQDYSSDSADLALSFPEVVKNLVPCCFIPAEAGIQGSR
jgi:hypothetical protein